jgi:hypothetical protein
MADWRRTLNIADAMEQTRDGAMEIQELARIIGTGLSAMKPFIGYSAVERERLELIDNFEAMAEDSGVIDPDTFDGLLGLLFDWGDIALDNRFNGKKVCFIQTF